MMMEDFRNIADETCPSFLGHSLNSSASAVFGNVTVSSNPGLPVAASTVARSKTNCGNREAATEDKQPQPASVGLKDSHSIYAKPDQSVTEQANHSQGTLFEVLPLERLEDLSTGICFLPDIENDEVCPPEPSEELTEREISSDHLSNSLSSFLENEKLSGLTSSEKNTTVRDDIDDEKFFDNQLEAYFEQLMQSELRRDTDIQRLSECCKALKLSENGLLQEQSFQVPDMYQALTGVDSGNANDENSQNEGITGCPVQQMQPGAVQQLFMEEVLQPSDRLPDAYLSPTPDSCESTILATTDKGDLPHSVVYQNEEGKWVTDLAYYTSFDKQEDLNLSEDDNINEFITGSEAAAMIAQDQEEFEKAHKVLQAKADVLNASELADTSWKSANSCVLRASDLDKDASYLRLSLGEFFGQRSEALGCLGGGSDVKRPSFGYYITSPEKRQPVALLTPPNSSGDGTAQETSQLSELSTDDLKAQTKEHASSASCQGAWQKMDTAAGIHKSMNTEAATRSEANDGIHKGKFEAGPLNNAAPEPCNDLGSNDKTQNAKLESRKKDASAACGGKAKHVTFEKLSPTSENSTEHKAECDLQPLEDEQYSFRPSTSPLTHSSPSDISGTAFSGSEAEFTSGSYYQESSCKEDVLTQSVYSSPTMSRLTYVSESDSTLKDSAVIDNSETYWNESASELSTTIVRASPTPSQERVAENLECSCQRSRKEALPTVDQKSEEYQLVGLQRKLDLMDQDPSKEGFPKNEEHLTSTCAIVAANRKEPDHPKSALPGCVKVPEELKFPNACCVGIASEAVLTISNSTKQWSQVIIGILSVSVNGEKMNPVKHQCLAFKNKTMVAPYSTGDVKILFFPSHPGIFQCILSVSSWPVSADKTIFQASRVVLTAVAETPDLEVHAGPGGILDFGDLTFGSWKALPLQVVNKTHAFVPLRFIINGDAEASSCFTFSKEPVSPSSEQSLQADTISQIASPPVVNRVIHASYDGRDPEALTVWVLFHAPKREISSSDSLGPADVFSASVDVELDSPGPSSVIKRVPLQARAGTAKIHVPNILKTMHLSARVGSGAKQQLPLKNAGNIGVHLKIKISDEDSCFSVLPQVLFLIPGEEQKLTVLFVPYNVRTTESSLEVLVLPFGPQYEVVLKGEVVSEGNRPVPEAVGGCSTIPRILSNKQFIVWGGVPLGTSVQQKLSLRNDSPSVTQHLRLLIRGRDQDCFQLQSIFGSEERSTINWELKICPKEDADIHLTFRPTRATCCFAKLEIKQLGIRSQPGIKFTIPLSGYGGTSNLILENVKKLPSNYLIDLKVLPPSTSKRATVHVKNTGSRAAYVKAVCLENLGAGGIMDPQVLMVSPEKFVVREGTQEVITITWNPMEINFQSPTSLLAAVWLFWGDEVSRQQYFRSRNCESEKETNVISEHSILRNIAFGGEFQGEQLVTEVCDIPQNVNHARLFYTSMRTISLFVRGYCLPELELLRWPSGCPVEVDSFENSVRRISESLGILPVKGPQVLPLPIETDELVQNKSDTQQPWTVEPECLILTSPSISGTTDTGHVRIVNNSNRTLAFELTWPVRCLTVTPQHGVVEPESSTQILVSPNPSLATKPSLIPWSGLIFIHCGNGQKSIQVQIREAVAGSVPGTDCPSGISELLSLQPDNSSAHVAKPAQVLLHPQMAVQIKNENLSFPRTRPGLRSATLLEMENKGNEDVKWHLSLITPPYVRDRSGGFQRATSSVFTCSPVSGTLAAHREMMVPVMFSPKSEGERFEFWNFECHPVDTCRYRYTIKLLFHGTVSSPPLKITVRSSEDQVSILVPETKKESLLFCQQAFEEEEIETTSVETTASTTLRPELPAATETKVCCEAHRMEAGQNELFRGVYAPEKVYIFPETRVGESCTLKVNLRNHSFATHLLKFICPREPFYIKHSKYILRSHYYIHVPVKFKPKEEGEFTGLFHVLLTKGPSISIQLYGRAIAN
ncbi:centrosomal protein of 192 kDa [Dryobates pubescens]|uniref:centrosomal protein of 192 kDa n=1 Tax=Dryobates pubescens TaxID=118200 RepID=UPI0023BA25E1|nr:centrosomal protein of 192 kDa [Dryobates pubescens]